MRRLPMLIAATLITASMTMTALGAELLGGPPEDGTAGHETDTYRYGYTYISERATTPAACEARCTSETSCNSWSTIPATFEIGPRCELKRNIGKAAFRPGAVSGVAVRFQPVAMAPERPASLPAPVPAPQPVQATPPQPASQPIRPVAASARQEFDAVRKPVRAAVVPKLAPAPIAQPALSGAPVAQASMPASTTMTTPRGFDAVRKPVQTSTAPPPQPAAPEAPPAQRRVPWNLRGNAPADYSVQGMDYLPGDKKTTAGGN